MTKGQKIRLSNGRRLVDDVIRSSDMMKLVTYSRDVDVCELARLRKSIRPRTSWNVIFMKAYAIVAERTPELRQCYVGFPWPYLYQHENNIASITISREHNGEERLLFAKINQPEKRSLVDLQEMYEVFRKSPINEIRQFRKQILFAKFPYLLRRLTFWMLFNLFPRKRMSNFGTYGMTISKYRDTHLTTNILGPNPVLLGVDVLSRKGISKFNFTFDHQILDGVPVINVIDEINRTLNGPIKKELKLLAEQQASRGGSQSPVIGEEDKNAA